MERTLLSPIAQEAPQQLASVRVRPAEYSGRVSSGCKRRSSTDFADSSDSSLAQKQLRKHQSLLAQEVQACSHAQLSCAVSLEIGDCTQINTSYVFHSSLQHELHGPWLCKRALGELCKPSLGEHLSLETCASSAGFERCPVSTSQVLCSGQGAQQQFTVPFM